MLSNQERKTAILITLVDRFILLSLPAALTMHKKVMRGSLLDNRDIQRLNTLMLEALENRHYVDKHPEIQPIYAKAVHMYHEIVAHALYNETQHNASTLDKIA